MKLAAVRKYAMSLPKVSEEPHFHFSSFRVRGKMIVTVPPEETHINGFVDDSQREPAVVKSLLRAAWEAKAPKSLLATTERGRQVR